MKRGWMKQGWMLVLLLSGWLCFLTVWLDEAHAQMRYDDEPLVLPSGETLEMGNRSWLPRFDLTYGLISSTLDLGTARTHAAVMDAFGLWAAVTPLTFTETVDCGLPFDAPTCTTPDIRLQFATGNHGDGFSFDGPAGVLAHAFYPPPNSQTAAGDAHFDDAELWSDDLPASGVDLMTVVLHEIGHSLGLAHAPIFQCPNEITGESSIMCPFYAGPHRFLARYDVDEIQSIYGPLACVDDPADPQFASFGNSRCRLSRLKVEVRLSGFPVALTKSLGNKLASITVRVNDAQAACWDRKTRKVTAKLQGAQRLMITFQKQVDKEVEKGNIPAVVATSLYESGNLLTQQLETRHAAPAGCE